MKDEGGDEKMKIEFPSLSEDLSKVVLPARVEPKYDGELNIWDGEKLINRYGTERWLPLCENLPKDMKLIGELYYGDGKCNFYEALPHLKNNSPKLKYKILGIYEANIPYIEQLYLTAFLPNRINGITAYSYIEVQKFAEIWIKEGYEGAVIKPILGKTSSTWIKYKPDKTIDLLILGVRKNKFSVAVGIEGKVFGHCSLNGFTEIQEKIKDMEIEKEDQDNYYFKNPSIIVEVQYLGIIKNHGIHLRHPRIKRLREDLKKENLSVYIK